MSCELTQTRLGRWYDDELEADEARCVAEHVVGTGEHCRAQLGSGRSAISTCRWRSMPAIWRSW